LSRRRHRRRRISAEAECRPAREAGDEREAKGDRKGWKMESKSGRAGNRIKGRSLRNGLSRITQTSRKTMGHHDRPSAGPLFGIAVDPDNGGQSHVARDRETWFIRTKWNRERARARERLHFAPGLPARRATTTTTTTRDLIARNNEDYCDVTRGTEVLFLPPEE